MKSRNTRDKGSTRYLIFHEDGRYFGIALELNLMVEASSYQEAFFELVNAVQGYVEAARKVKVRDDILNQKPDAEYEGMWTEYQDEKLRKKYQKYLGRILNAGRMTLANA
ncbi:MAG: hypothetical protein Q8P39_00650 [Candidatus Yanofskybacteria bacterium]|nr:hypothetical protein [Candidatus Yanofskybacteria bacterium]